MASTLTNSAKQQKWGSDDRARQLVFIKEAISMLTGARDFYVIRNGIKSLVIGAGIGERKPRTALCWLRDNAVSIVFPREAKQ
jgi:hypothetical protein